MWRRALTALIIAYTSIVTYATLRPFQFDIPPVLRGQLLPPPEWSGTDGMIFRGAGAFALSSPTPHVFDALAGENGFHLYVEIRPERDEPKGRAIILGCASSPTHHAFTLGQEGSDLLFALGGSNRARQTDTEHRVSAHLAGGAWHAVLVTVTPELLTLAANGRVLLERRDPVFESMRGGATCCLVAGNGAGFAYEWRGALRRISLGTGAPPEHLARAAAGTAPVLDGLPATTLIDVSPGSAPPDGWEVATTPLAGRLARPWSLTPFTEPPSRRWARTDWTLNALLLFPLGTLLALRRSKLLLVAFGLFALSLGIELTQIFLPARHTQTTDLVLNVAGGLAGAIMVERARAAWHKTGRRRDARGGTRTVDGSGRP